MCVGTLITTMAEGLGASAATAETIGTTLQAVGALSQGIAGYKAGQAQASVAEANAANARSMERKIGDQAADKAQRLRLTGKSIAGKQKSALGAAGVAGGRGSATAILMDTYKGVERDIRTTEDNANMKAEAYEAQARNYDAQADAASSQGNWALASGILSAGSAVLTSPMVDSSWYSEDSMLYQSGQVRGDDGLLYDSYSGRRG